MGKLCAVDPCGLLLVQVFLMQQAINGGAAHRPGVETLHFGYPLMATTAGAIVSWFYRQAPPP